MRSSSCVAPSSTPRTWDWAVIGSGFGGSVAALRLAQKGYRVVVLEAGRRFAPEDFPRSSWDARRYLWAPSLGCRGILRMNLLPHVFALSGAGVGGGSLVYGNTLFRPPPAFFDTAPMRHLGGGEALLPWYELASRMMGVVPNPRLFEPDDALRSVAASFGRADTFAPSPVGVYFGDGTGRPEKDPYFEGDGPTRSSCTHCGACFLGCRVGAKNSLDQNYLYLAEKLGSTVIPEARVASLRALSPDGADGYELRVESTAAGRTRSPPLWLRARGVVVAAGVLGTLRLLLGSRDEGALPGLPDAVGHDVRTNGEVIVGVTARHDRLDFSRGLAASSSVFPDAHTQIQADRYPAGSDTMALLSTLLVDGGGPLTRPLRLAATLARHPLDAARVALPFGFARRSMILVVMQDLESRLTVGLRRGFLGGRKLTSTADGDLAPTYVPLANEFARRLAKQVDGIPRSALSEVLLGVPVSAHMLGGCTLSNDGVDGVLDARHQLRGYRNLVVCDASAIPGNLGVNPALTVLALSERAMSFVPERQGEARRFAFERAWGVDRLLDGKQTAPRPARGKRKPRRPDRVD